MSSNDNITLYSREYANRTEDVEAKDLLINLCDVIDINNQTIKEQEIAIRELRQQIHLPR